MKRSPHHDDDGERGKLRCSYGMKRALARGTFSARARALKQLMAAHREGGDLDIYGVAAQMKREMAVRGGRGEPQAAIWRRPSRAVTV